MTKSVVVLGGPIGFGDRLHEELRGTAAEVLTYLVPTDEDPDESYAVVTEDPQGIAMKYPEEDPFVMTMDEAIEYFDTMRPDYRSKHFHVLKRLRQLVKGA